MPATSRRRHIVRHRTRSPLRKPEPLYPRPQNATWGMAPACGLIQPSLDGIPAVIRSMSGDGTAVALARTLLTLGIARPEDWASSGRTANAFVDATFAHLFNAHGGADISRVFSLDGALDLCMDGIPRTAIDFGPQDVPTCYLSIYPGYATFVELGPALDRLERSDKRLAATFYRAVMEGLLHVGRAFGYEDAVDYHAMLMECVDPEEADEYEIPDPSSSKRPAYTAKRYKSKAAIDRALGQCRDKEAVAWVRAALALAALPLAPMDGLVPEDVYDHFDGETVPFTLLVNKEGDTIQACFDAQTEGWGACSGPPMFLAQFNPADPTMVARAVLAYTETLDVLRHASALLQMLPNNDYTATANDWTDQPMHATERVYG